MVGAFLNMGYGTKAGGKIMTDIITEHYKEDELKKVRDQLNTVDQFYEQLENMDTLELINVMNIIRVGLETATEIKTNLQKKYDALRLNLVPSAMDDDGVSNITVEGIGRVGLTGDIYASIPADKKPEAWKWLRDNNHDIIKETINAGTLKATLKAIIKAGEEEIPEGLFKITPFTRASITKK